MRVEGTVVVELTVTADGSVSHGHAVSGHPLLMQAAEDCVSHWRFMPMTKAEHGTVSVVFSLSE
jgi:TonB family protein